MKSNLDELTFVILVLNRLSPNITSHVIYPMRNPKITKDEAKNEINQWFEKFGIRLGVTTSFLSRINRYIQSKKPNIIHPMNETCTLYKAYDHFAIIDAALIQPIDRLRQLSTTHR